VGLKAWETRRRKQAHQLPESWADSLAELSNPAILKQLRALRLAIRECRQDKAWDDLDVYLGKFHTAATVLMANNGFLQVNNPTAAALKRRQLKRRRAG
jgi:DNA-binding GntR family transcriptional regulator